MKQQKSKSAAGFSLLELLVAMTVSLLILAAATKVLSGGFKIRSRENSVSDAAADAQRALNIMSREIANAGFRLTTNGVVAGDSDSTHIRVRSNLNAYDASASVASRNGVIDPGEDIKYFINTASNTDYLVRHDANATTRTTTVLANRVDSLRIHYFNQKVTYNTSGCDITGASSTEVTPDLANYIVFAVCVQIPAVGVQGSDNYQPATNVLLVSDVVLRNSSLTNY